MRSRTSKQTSGTILWIAVVVLVLAALGNHQQIETCIGACCQQAEWASQHGGGACGDGGCGVGSCGDGAPERGVVEEAACCCCGGSEDGSSRPDRERPDRERGDTVRGSCGPGCCITIALDIEMAPAGAAIDVEDSPLGAPPRAALTGAQIAHRETRRLRPFDRGPPRIDRGTALRACTVLQV